jgi:RHS repeat-associated protein
MNLYQGKEKQDELDLNLFDFHARQYDPTIGRTTTIDPHADNYGNLSPYSWVGNNPIITIDPDGMDFVIARYKDLDDETRKKYTKSEYREMRKEGKSAIQRLKQGSVTAKAMIRDLKKSDNTHTVTFSKDSRSNQQTDQQTGDSKIVIDLTEKTEGLETASQEMNTSVLAGHEIAHSWREEHGLDPQRMSPEEALKDLATAFKNEDQRKAVAENGATHIENMVRSELKVPLRGQYPNGRGGSYYDLRDSNYNYHQRHNIHQNHKVRPIRRTRKKLIL